MGIKEKLNEVLEQLNDKRRYGLGFYWYGEAREEAVANLERQIQLVEDLIEFVEALRLGGE